MGKDAAVIIPIPAEPAVEVDEFQGRERHEILEGIRIVPFVPISEKTQGDICRSGGA